MLAREEKCDSYGKKKCWIYNEKWCRTEEKLVSYKKEKKREGTAGFGMRKWCRTEEKYSSYEKKQKTIQIFEWQMIANRREMSQLRRKKKQCWI